MRSIWKGSISFGLVSVPIKVFAATSSHSVSFHQLHTEDGGRIRYRKVCELDGEEVPREEIGRGYETDDGTTVYLTDDDLAELPLPTAKTVEILAFVPAEEIDPIHLDRSYYLAADGQRAAKPYVLLREALVRSGKVAVAKMAMRGRESLGMLRVYEDSLALHTMLWPDEIRSASGVAPEERVTVRDAELDLADTLMETLGELDWAELRDEYREALEELVEEKSRQGGAMPTAERGPPSGAARRRGQVVDLVSVLENSVQAARDSRSGDATVHQLSEKQPDGGRAAGGTASTKGAGATAEKQPRKARKRAASEKTAAGRPTRSRTGTAKTSAKAGAAKKTADKQTATKRTPAKKTASKAAGSATARTGTRAPAASSTSSARSAKDAKAAKTARTKTAKAAKTARTSTQAAAKRGERAPHKAG